MKTTQSRGTRSTSSKATSTSKSTRKPAAKVKSRKALHSQSSLKQLEKDVKREVVNSIKSVFPASPVPSASNSKNATVRGVVRSARNAVTTGATQVAQQVNKLMNGAGTAQRRQKSKLARSKSTARATPRKSSSGRSARPLMTRAMRKSTTAASARSRRTA